MGPGLRGRPAHRRQGRGRWRTAGHLAEEEAKERQEGEDTAVKGCEGEQEGSQRRESPEGGELGG